MITLQDYTQAEAARLLGYSDRWVRKWYPRALDELSLILIHGRILNQIPGHEINEPEVNQGKRPN